LTLPRYFIPRAGAVLEPLASAERVARPLDAFELRTGETRTEWVVGFDEAGRFVAERRKPGVPLLPITRRQIAFHEVAAGGRRTVNLQALHVFEATLVEHTADCAGINDPVYLYGRLVGPLSALPGAPPPFRIEGQLTTTRGDLLSAFVSASRWPFHRPDETGHQVERVFRALLPAERDDETGRGEGGVVAYPVLSGDPTTDELFPGNDEMVKQILYELLTGLWRDVEAEEGDGYRSPGEIPLVKRNLPLTNYLELAAEALHMSPLWPSPAVLAVNRRVEVPPAPPRPAAPELPRRPRFFRWLGQRPPEWVETFIRAHLGPGATTPPHTTPSASGAPAAQERWGERTTEEVLAALERRYP
jgi:hypothetical protein